MNVIPFTVKSLTCESREETQDGRRVMVHHLIVVASTGDQPVSCYGIAHMREDGLPGFTNVPIFGEMHTGCTLMCKPNSINAAKMGEIVAVVPAAPSRL